MDKSVSIIAPAYNHVKYIESCLRSIANQKCEDMELIVLDDCSKDGTQNVIRQIIAEESFQKSFSMGIRFIPHSENKGAHDTINEGLMMAKGKYLAVINTDDAFGENHLAGLLDACEREGSEFAFGGVRVVDENDRPVTNGFAKAIMKYQDTARMCPTATMALTRGNCTISTGNMVFTSRLYCKLEGFRNYKYVHDWDFALRAALITEPVFVPDAYYIYRLHIGNTIGELANNLEDTCKMADGIDQVGPNPLVEFLKKILLGQYTNKSIPSREVWEYFFTQKKYFADDHDGEYAWNEAKKLQNENNTFSKMKDELFSEKDRQLENVREQLREKEEELLNLQDKYDDLQRMYNKVQFNYDEISNAFFWKATGPLRRALDKGKNRFRRNIYARRIWHTLKWICYKGKVPGSYNLWPAEANLIYDPNDPMTILCTKHTWFISQLIQNSLKKAGIEADILIDEPAEYSKRLHIVVCPQMFRRLPSKYISFQMEQTISSRWLNKTYLNILENSYAVFDYSLKNIEYFRKTVDFSRMFYYLPVDYLPGIRREKDDYEYDVVFYGDPNSGRRQVILKQLEEHFNIKIISEVFGEELYSELSKAKVVVNIHYYENAMLETTRLYETLSLGKSVVVSERSSDPKEDERLQGIVDFVPVDNLGLMIDKISWWLSHEEERRAAVERNNDTFAHHSSAFDYYFLRFLLANDWLSFDEFYRLAGDFVNFDKNHICVSLPESTERGRAFRDEIRDKNIEFQLFPALRHRRGWTGCGLSYKFIMKKAQEQNMDSILICEDDVFLPDDFDYRWALCEAYLNKSDDWDIFQGMMSDIGDVNISAAHKELGQTFVHMDHMISAVFNYYRKNIFERVVSWDEKNDDVDSNTFDRVLESQELRVVCTDPFLVGHKDDLYSDIWGFRNYQYKSLIEDSSKKLNKLVKEFETGGLSDYGFTYTSNSENRKKQDDAYKEWIKTPLFSETELEQQRQRKFDVAITFSIVVPLYNTPKEYLCEMIESVQAQTYSNWEFCMADGSDGSHSEVEKICREYAEHDERIKYKKLEKNLGISENTNACIKMSTGDYIALFDHDDILHPSALHEMMIAICEKNADFIYTDEAVFISPDIHSISTIYFKPDYAPDSLRANNYICHFTAFKKALLDETGLLRKEFDGSQDHDLILRLTNAAHTIVHIPEVLYYWRAHQNSVALSVNAKEYAADAGRRAVLSSINALGYSAEVYSSEVFPTVYRIKYDLKSRPLVSIIIPTSDHYNDLKKCLSSIREKTTYDNYEIILIENNSKDPKTFDYYNSLNELFDNIKIVTWNGNDAFNYSSLNNYGINTAATGDYYLLLNNDTEIITPSWIEEMLMYAQRDDVGAVGAKLYYPDDTIQHAGVIVGLGGVAGHSFTGNKKTDHGYMGRLCYAQNVSAVTGACMMIRKDVWDTVGGLDEGFAVAFNDTDLCMRIRQKDYLIVWTPYAELYHYESKSRGYEDTPEKQKRFNSEIARFRIRWSKELEKGDPYYNPNLTLSRNDYSLKYIDYIR